MTDRKTRVGERCRSCERPITSRAWLRAHPYTDTCGARCFRYAVEAEEAEFQRRHPGSRRRRHAATPHRHRH